MPSASIGFSVARTRNGVGTLKVSWPIVTWCSCITSSSADWTLAGRAVDLVGEQEVGEDGAQLDIEAGLVRAVDARPDEVGRHQVRRELDALERAAEDVGEGLDRERLGEAGHALEEEVAARQQADEDPLEHRVLADDDPPDLEQDGLGGGPRIGRVGEGAEVGAAVGVVESDMSVSGVGGQAGRDGMWRRFRRSRRFLRVSENARAPT